jgi:hypothetical protein
VSTLPPLGEVALPEWVGRPLSGESAESDASGAERSAVATDVAGAIGAPASLSPFLNPLGAYATFLAQREKSIARNSTVRLAEALSAFAFDLFIGATPGVPGAVQPLVPVLDALVLAPASEALGTKLGIADNVNGILRGLFASLDARVSGGGGAESQARARARAETGDMGEVTRLLTSFLHWCRGTDVGS